MAPLGRGGFGAGQGDRRGDRVADERPASGRLGRRLPRRRADPRAGGLRGAAPAERPQRGERVVGHLAGPGEGPERVEQAALSRGRLTALADGRDRGGEEIAVEARPAPGQVLAQGVGEPGAGSRAADGLGRRIRGRPLGGRRLWRRREEEGEPVGAVEGDPPVVPPQGPVADPGDLAGCAQLVEEARRVTGDARRKDVALQDAGGQRQALELRHCLGQAVETASPSRPDPLPGREEARERGRLDRLDLAPQARQRAAAQAAQHLRVAPLAFGAAGTELPAHERSGGEHPLQRRLDGGRRQAPAPRRLGRQEGSVAARPATQQRDQRVGARGQEGGRRAGRQRHAEGVADAPRLLGRDPTLLPGDPNRERAVIGGEDGEPCLGGGPPLPHLRAADPGRHLVGGEIAEAAEEIVHRVGRAGGTLIGERLELELQLGESGRIEQFAQLLGAEKLAQELAVKGQRLGTPVGQRSVALVHVGGDVVEEQRTGERRGAARLDVVDADLASFDGAQDLAQSGQVEDVLEALAERLEEDRERAVATHHAEQLRRPLAHQPEWPARLGAAARQQERSRRVLAEVRREERRPPERLDHEVLGVVGAEEDRPLGGGDGARALEALGRRREAHHDAVVRPDRLHLHAEPLAQARLDRQRPRGVDARPERREEADPPVAQLVAEALDDDRPVGRHGAGGRLLLGHVVE